MYFAIATLAESGIWPWKRRRTYEYGTENSVAFSARLATVMPAASAASVPSGAASPKLWLRK